MKKFKRIIVYLKPYFRYVFLNVMFNMLSVIFGVFSITMVIPFLGILFKTQPMVENPMPFAVSIDVIQHNFNYTLSRFVESKGEIYALVFVSILAVIMSLFKTAFRYFAMYNLAPIRNGVVKDIRNSLYDKVLILPLSFFSRERKGDIISRMTNDVQELEWSIINSLELVFREPITILVYLISLFIISPPLTLFVLVLLPMSGLLIGWVGRNLRDTALKGQNKMGVILSLIEETLSGMRIIKGFNAEDKMRRRFHSTNSLYTRIMIKMYRKQYMATPMSEFLGTAVTALIMGFGGYLVLGEVSTLSSQGFIGYLLLFAMIINPAKSVSTAYYAMLKGMASADRIEMILNADISINEKENAIEKKGFENSIEFRGVGFRYEEEWVLRDINLKIEKGQTLAIVGQSGAGKSTLADLIPRFFDVVEGQIFIDGEDIRDISIKDLRNLMGIVNQDPILFNDSFYNNIAFGMKNVSEAEVIEAAKVANAHDFVSQTPLGYYNNIGDRGGKLSGGQKQRVSIARAVIKNPPIMILDEATSALDTESEHLVQEALTRLMKNRTSIVIAHRLSTVRNADYICVLHEGKVAEFGRHNELIEADGIYNKLLSLQMIQ
jgi:ATP-binding cassette, subfamily B, bacterial MsbA